MADPATSADVSHANAGAAQTTDVNTPPSDPPVPDAPPQLNLLIKNPTDRPGTAPFSLSIPLSATVLALKEKLSQVYPGTPAATTQRLIYAGKLLEDRQPLRTLMPAADLALQHTLHLVVSNRNRPSPAPRASAAPAAAATAPAAPAAPAAPVAPLPPPGTMPLPPTMPMPSLGMPYNPYMQYPPMYANDAAPYPMPYAQQFPYPPPPSDVPGFTETGNAPFTPMDPAAYAAHLQAMERMLAESLAAQQNNAQEAAPAAGAAAGADGPEDAAQRQLADQRAQLAAASAAAAVAMHAQAHAQAMANYEATLRAQADNNAQAAQPFPVPQNMRGGFRFQMGRVDAPADAANPQAAWEPRVRQFVFQFEINWGLISKLIFLVYLLGQEGSPRRVYTLTTIALAIYLWQTNRLGFLRRIAGMVLPNPTQLFEMLFPRQPAAGGSVQQGQRATHRYGRLAVFLSFAYSFVYGFVCSLLPAWRPEPLPRLEELLDQDNDENGAAAAEGDIRGEPGAVGNGNAGADAEQHAHAE